MSHEIPNAIKDNTAAHVFDAVNSDQLLTYTDDTDLNVKLKAWENFYNYDRPHLSLEGKTPYEVMKALLK